MGHSKNCSQREVYSNAMLPQETRKVTNNLILHPKQLEKEEQTKQEIIKIRAEINKMEMKKAIAIINENKSQLFEQMTKFNKALSRLMKKTQRQLKSIQLEMEKKLQWTAQKQI